MMFINFIPAVALSQAVFQECNHETITCEYDLLGQLIRVNDPYDTTASTSGTTWGFEYDLSGNIQKKIAYAYTTGNVGSPVQTDFFDYGASTWKDMLTAFNGKTISYDKIGNPINDGTWNFVWKKGRELASMSSATASVAYEYNEEGYRVQKNSNSTGLTKYSLHGSKIMHLVNGGNNLHFFYDAKDKPAIVLFNDIAYSYLYNLQGDVTALLDNTGTKVVEYAYDAWGKLLSKTGILAASLGTLNPFRYRSYVYDEETGLYYLQSRYYNPLMCRFISPDYILATAGGIPDKSAYAYCQNNPICAMTQMANGVIGLLVL